ncbi:unannotated protein [freshwater metagenome]|uniref:Unannotated protein n=1 Tax=freshwater metagenome TaxID=449393 RepID=A0A6J6EBH4_9ZZZZ
MYFTPFTSEVSTQLVVFTEFTSNDQLTPLSDERSTLYPVRVYPPLSAGADQVTVARPSPGTASSNVGAEAVPPGVAFVAYTLVDVPTPKLVMAATV